jgi:hypothetical protein
MEAVTAEYSAATPIAVNALNIIKKMKLGDRQVIHVKMEYMIS